MEGQMIQFDRTIFNRTTPNVWRRWIDMKGISIRDVCLRNADLSRLDLRRLDLRDANLDGADLTGADLRNAKLDGANLRGADLTGADLRNAKLDGVNVCGSVGFYLQCPETGAFIGWKRVGKHIIKLQITEMALRSSATGRKCRCSEALVLAIDDGALQEVINYNFSRTVYKVGEVVRPDRFDACRWEECANGIHFFITRKEAEEYCCSSLYNSVQNNKKENKMIYKGKNNE